MFEYPNGCPACGEPIDYCQGHGELGDPLNHEVLQLHDQEDHHLCHPLAECNFRDVREESEGSNAFE